MFNRDIVPFPKKIWLSSPTMHGDEIKYILDAYNTNWMSTVGENINEIEKEIANMAGVQYAVGLSSGTASLHLCMKLAGVEPGIKVACSDMTFDATVNPVKYQGGEPVFIDTEYDTWNMDPKALNKAFDLYPDIRVVVVANLYGTPGKIDELESVCNKYGATLIEDAAESFGATYKGKPTGSFGSYNAISFNGNKIITGSSGGMLLTNDKLAMLRARKWSTQSRDAAPWYQHEEIGYNYRMSNVIAGVVRGQIPHLSEHISQKRGIYQRYKDGFVGFPVTMNPFDETHSIPNFWLSCLLIDERAMCKQARDEHHAVFCPESGKTCPTEIIETLAKFNVESRPIWKPMHMQPLYRMNKFVTVAGEGRGMSDAYIGNISDSIDIGADIFNRGLCLPSDNKMTVESQKTIIEIVKDCFN